MKTLITLLLVLMLSATAHADCELTIDSNDAMQFDTTAMSAPASCTSITVTLTHSGTMAANVMGHNWVLVKTSEMQAVLNDGWPAGLDNDYVKPGDDRVLAMTKVIGGGETTSVTFETAGMSSDGDYTFVCTFPGHFAVMKGSFKLT